MDWPLPDDSMTPPSTPSLAAGNTNRIPNPWHWDPVMSRSTTVSRSYWKAGIQHLNLDLAFFSVFLSALLDDECVSLQYVSACVVVSETLSNIIV